MSTKYNNLRMNNPIDTKFGPVSINVYRMISCSFEENSSIN